MRYGYYLPARKSLVGDPEFSALAAERWDLLQHPDPQRCDGVSIWSDDKGFHVRILVRDFFLEKFRVAQAMVGAS